MPAKLFLAILRAHIQTGKTVFFLSEFRRMKGLLGEPPNLEGRLARLAARLEEKTPSVRLLRGRGFRVLETENPVGLEEI